MNTMNSVGTNLIEGTKEWDIVEVWVQVDPTNPNHCVGVILRRDGASQNGYLVHFIHNSSTQLFLDSEGHSPMPTLRKLRSRNRKLYKRGYPFHVGLLPPIPAWKRFTSLRGALPAIISFLL